MADWLPAEFMSWLQEGRNFLNPFYWLYDIASVWWKIFWCGVAPGLSICG